MKNKMGFLNMLLFLIALLPYVMFGQPDHPCAHSRLAAASDERTATLSQHYISLTNEYDVHFYFLDLEIERTSNDVAGTAEVHATSTVALLDTFLIELEENLEITEIRLNGTSPIAFTRDGSAVIIETSFELGDDFFFAFDYSGAATPGGGGPFGDDGMNNAWEAGTQITWSISVPFYAYEWFPCKQSLTDKADSSYVFITTDESNLAGSNGLLTDVVDLPGGKKRFEWKSTNPIAYYLISVSVAEYVEYILEATPFGGAGPIPVQCYFFDFPGDMDLYEWGAEETVRYLEYFSEILGGYPFDNEKYGYTMAPIGGAMEHQTMTTTGVFTRRIIAHELGHQWFGNHVSCATWADMWLKEGLTSYMEDLALEEFYPSEAADYMYARHEFIMSELGGSVHVEDTLDLSDIYDSRLTYTKGPAILHTLRFIINNDELFFEVIKTYLENYGSEWAYTLEFKDVLESVTGNDYTAFFDEWYYGEGFPVYNITYEQVGEEVTLELSQNNAFFAGVDLFTNDLEIAVYGSGYSEVFRLEDITAETSVHDFTFPAEIITIVIDPNHWIINRNGTIDGETHFTSIDETMLDELVVYPNPSNNILYVSDREGSNYSIYNLQGQCVKHGQLENDQISLEAIAKGQYYIQIGNGRVAFIKN